MRRWLSQPGVRWAGGLALAAAVLVPVVSTLAFTSAPSRATTTLGSRHAGAIPAGQPRPTSTPESPGIAIADPNDIDTPDPFILASGGRYYLYLSTAFGDPTGSSIPLFVGYPGHWGPIRDALPTIPNWAASVGQGADFWDPTVVKIGGHYVMYFAPQVTFVARPSHCIGVAVASSPAGPFTPVGSGPIVCQTSLGGDIDADPVFDPHGPRGAAHPYYLVWKSDDNNLVPPQPTEIWAAPLSNNGLSLSGTAVPIFSGQESWEQPVLEAPQMATAPDGKNWLFFSAGTGYFSPRYAMGAALCSSVMGPCHDVYTGPIISTNAQGSGPGEETYFEAPDGSSWLLYSPWHTANAADFFRPVEAARIGWGSFGPYVAQAGSFPLPSSLSSSNRGQGAGSTQTDRVASRR